MPENLFGFPPQIEPKPNADNTFIFKETSRELEEFLLRENDNVDLTVFLSYWLKYQMKFNKNLMNYSAKIPTKNG